MMNGLARGLSLNGFGLSGLTEIVKNLNLGEVLSGLNLQLPDVLSILGGGTVAGLNLPGLLGQFHLDGINLLAFLGQLQNQGVDVSSITGAQPLDKFDVTQLLSAIKQAPGVPAAVAEIDPFSAGSGIISTPPAVAPVL
uniref:DUF937 domain-containing protein n=1 Tax=Rhabditophanes sp. KR3021 TaxID=114890 RepID=A0AC35TM78_9BILA